jgi:hypothetical protein
MLKSLKCATVYAICHSTMSVLILQSEQLKWRKIKSCKKQPMIFAQIEMTTLKVMDNNW